MPSARVSALTRNDITAAARKLRNTRPAKWTVIVDGRELPARPLILAAAGVPPNDPTNSHQAVKILQNQGFDVRYQGEAIPGEGKPTDDEVRAMDELIQNAEEADEAAAELAGETKLAQNSEQFETLLAILYAEAGKLYPGNWEDYPKAKFHI